MSLAINHGRLIDPANRIDSKLNVLIENGKIKSIATKPYKADTIIDATNKVITPGFIDIHMHEPSINTDNQRFDLSTFESMLKMGVTTAIGGNCGFGAADPIAYLRKVDNEGIPTNLGMLLPHNSLRLAINFTDKYKSASKIQITEMANQAYQWLTKGLAGVSFGLRYVPGATTEEYFAVAQMAKEQNKLVAAHIRDDAAGVFDALDEFISFGLDGKTKMQVSHIGSMAAFGQMESFLSSVDEYKNQGVDIACDCYPYYAFCVAIGRTTYDDGFIERYQTDYNAIEILEGTYKNKRCTPELFSQLRQFNPDVLTTAHVMKHHEVDMALLHPNVMIASDGVLNNYDGHPRSAGTFPKAIRLLYKERKSMSLYEVIRKMTAMPAQRLGIDKGNLGLGKDADLVIFDEVKINDKATFTDPVAAPEGIKYVLIGGKIATKDNEIVHAKLGKSVRIL